MGDGIVGLEVGIGEAADEGSVVGEEDWRPATEQLVEVPDTLVESIQLPSEG